MYAVAVAIALLLSVTGCVCQLPCDAIEGKIQAIFNDMNTSPDENLVVIDEMYAFFSGLTTSGTIDIATGDSLSFLDFDYTWGTNYVDDRGTTQYLWNAWDVNNDSVLDSGDINALFATISTYNYNGQYPVCNDIIPLHWRFMPYMKKMYADAGACIP